MSASLPDSVLISYRGKTNIFIETGTSEGDSVETARLCGFSKIFSIESDIETFNIAFNRFKNFPNISIFNGKSIDILPDLLKEIHEPVLFWLDAHSDCESEMTPIFQELDIIETFEFASTVLMDDIRLIGCGMWKFSLPDLLEKIYKINPKFEIIFQGNAHNPYDILIAADKNLYD